MRFCKPLLWLNLVIVTLQACGPTTVEQKKAVADTSAEVMINVNKYLIKQDEEAIKGYIARHNWQMQQTGSGLWFQLYKNGKGIKVQANNTVTIKYKLELLDGTFCYSSDTTGPKKIKLGNGQAENGLEEGLQLLRVGDAARFILLPHLAQGLTSNDPKIPLRATLVYDVELINLEP